MKIEQAMATKENGSVGGTTSGEYIDSRASSQPGRSKLEVPTSLSLEALPCDWHIDYGEVTHYPGARQVVSRTVRSDSSGRRIPYRSRRGGGKRGKVAKVFSKSQQRNMRSFLSKLKQDEPAHFMTLKYPKDDTIYPPLGFPTVPRIYLGHLNNMLRRLKRRYPTLAAVWRLEFDSRGAPHFHVLLYNLPDDAVQDLESMWLGVLGTEAKPSGHVHVEKVISFEAVAEYLAKRQKGQLVSKYIEHEGCHWGKFNIASLPLSTEVCTFMKAEAHRKMRRSMRKYRDKTSNRKIPLPPGETIRLLRGNADEWKRLADYLNADQVTTRSGGAPGKDTIEVTSSGEEKVDNGSESEEEGE